VAAQNGHVDALRVLVEYKADVNAAQKVGLLVVCSHLLLHAALVQLQMVDSGRSLHVAPCFGLGAQLKGACTILYAVAEHAPGLCGPAGRSRHLRIVNDVLAVGGGWVLHHGRLYHCCAITAPAFHGSTPALVNQGACMFTICIIIGRIVGWSHSYVNGSRKWPCGCTESAGGAWC